jgi:hypothetical protein
MTKPSETRRRPIELTPKRKQIRSNPARAASIGGDGGSDMLEGLGVDGRFWYT